MYIWLLADLGRFIFSDRHDHQTWEMSTLDSIGQMMLDFSRPFPQEKRRRTLNNVEPERVRHAATDIMIYVHYVLLASTNLVSGDPPRYRFPQPVNMDDRGSSSFVREAAEIEQSLSAGIFTKDAARTADRLAKTLEKYQEQSELLDPHLEKIINKLMVFILPSLSAESLLREPEADKALKLTKTNLAGLFEGLGGFSTRFARLEVHHLEAVLRLLVREKQTDYSTWHTRYGLLLWLSLIVLIPFDLATIDSTYQERSKQQQEEDKSQKEEGGHSSLSLVDSLVDIGKKYLHDAGPCRDAASFFLARLFTRKDLHSIHLDGFVKWAAAVIHDKRSSAFLITGALQALAGILRLVPRSSVQAVLPHITAAVIKDTRLLQSGSSLLRKLAIKVAQRAALALLPVKLATWRYQRGRRLLIQNLNHQQQQHQEGEDQEEKETRDAKEEEAKKKEDEKDGDGDDDEEEEDYDPFPEDVTEDAIEVLLQGLCDKDTIVRWSAAKGIGRITSRLPKTHGDDVVVAVLELVSPNEHHTAWHGACLSIAELARRGLILPRRLGLVVPRALQALVYDVRQGSHSVGAHVRDAACYVAWAFARAYAPSVMKPYVQMLAQSLLTVAVFDREINVRRAAAAAFQEHVGRQGNFPHGIVINTTADYFTLGNRKRAFLDIALFVAKFPEYREPLIAHLLSTKSRHWDKKVRSLAADSLRRMALLDPEYMAEIAIPILAKRASTTSADVADRHGSCLCVAKIVDGLYDSSSSKQSSGSPAAAMTRKRSTRRDCSGKSSDDTMAGEGSFLSPDACKMATGLVPLLQENSQYLMGKGGALIREAVCELIRAIAHARLIDMVEGNLCYNNPDVQDKAMSALEALFSSYYEEKEGVKKETKSRSPPPKILAACAPRFMKHISQGQFAASNPPHKRRDAHTMLSYSGYTMAIAALPKQAILPILDNVLHSLCLGVNKMAESSPEARKAAIESLCKVCIRISTRKQELCQPISQMAKHRLLGHHVFDTLVQALDDYQIDRRGDVGSWVREAAVRAFREIVPILSQTERFVRGEDSIDAQSSSDHPPSGHISLWTARMGTRLVCGLLKQLSEKISRTRREAGETFEYLVKLSFTETTTSNSSIDNKAVLQSSSSQEKGGIGKEMKASASSSSSSPPASSSSSPFIVTDLPNRARLLEMIQCAEALQKKAETDHNVADLASGTAASSSSSQRSGEKKKEKNVETNDDSATAASAAAASGGKGAYYDDSSSSPPSFVTQTNWGRGSVTFPAVVTLMKKHQHDTKEEDSKQIRVSIMGGILLSWHYDHKSSCFVMTADTQVSALSQVVMQWQMTSVENSSLTCDGDDDVDGGGVRAIFASDLDASMSVQCLTWIEAVRNVAEDILHILTRHRGERRVTQNVMKTLALLLQEESFSILIEEGKMGEGARWGLKLVKTISTELGSTEDVNLLLAGGRVYLGVLAFPGLARNLAIRKCLALLEHAYPKVRSTIAEEMYSQLLVLEDEFEDLEGGGDEEEGGFDTVLEKLAETSWNAALSEIYDSLDTLHIVFGFEKPVRLKKEEVGEANKTEQGGKKKKETKNAAPAPSYLDLVKEMGF
eukprot:jgi/Bigna1/78286/fgenesh1_pg.53_\